MGYVGKVTAGGSTHLVGSTLYGTCDTAAGTAAKVVTCSDFTTLITGVTIHVLFTNSNTSTGTITLNVNSTGAKNIYKAGTTKPGATADTSWPANSVVSFTYDGNYWRMNDHIDNFWTDTHVMQSKATDNDSFPLLASNSTVSEWGSTTTTAGEAKLATAVYLNPSTGNIGATKFNGYTLGAACEKAVGSIASGNAGLVTGGDVYTAIQDQIAGATQFQGSLVASGGDGSTTWTEAQLEASSYKKGMYWVVAASGTFVGETCEAGDFVFCVADKSSAYSASDFSVVQENIDTISNADIDTIIAS